MLILVTKQKPSRCDEEGYVAASEQLASWLIQLAECDLEIRFWKRSARQLVSDRRHKILYTGTSHLEIDPSTLPREIATQDPPVTGRCSGLSH